MSIKSDRVRELRIKSNLTQKELGEKVGVTKVSVSGYETGIRNPDTYTLTKLADVLNVSTDYLLGRTAHQGLPLLHNENITSEQEQLLYKYLEYLRYRSDDNDGE